MLVAALFAAALLFAAASSGGGSSSGGPPAGRVWIGTATFNPPGEGAPAAQADSGLGVHHVEREETSCAVENPAGPAVLEVCDWRPGLASGTWRVWVTLVSEYASSSRQFTDSWLVTLGTGGTLQGEHASTPQVFSVGARFPLQLIPAAGGFRVRAFVEGRPRLVTVTITAARQAG